MKSIKMAVPTCLALTMFASCGGGDSLDAKDVPEIIATPATTHAQMSGTVIKGTLQGASISVTALNGSALILEPSITDDTGTVFVSMSGEPGFGISSIVKITATADSTSSMICDAVDCGGVSMGSEVRGPAIAGTELSTMTFISVPYGSNDDANADGTFHVNALTNMATLMIEQAISEGRNVSSQALLELAQNDFSGTVLKALGSNLNVNIFSLEVISAESLANFVTSTSCEQTATNDEDGNPILDDDGNAVTEEVCTDTYIDMPRLKLSLINGALASYAEGFSQSSALAVATANMKAALAGNPDALIALRQPLVDSLAANPVLAELGLTPLDIIDPELALFDAAANSGPTQEVTSDANLSDAIITARNRIGDGEAETMAFDGDTNTKWLDHNDWSGAPTVEDPSWVQVQFAEAHAVSSLFITSANDADVRDPENFDLLASNDGVIWVTLAEFIGESFDERFQRKEFRFSNGLEYSYYRLNITKNKGDDTLMQIAEIQLVGPIYESVDHTDPIGTGVITARNRIGDGEAETMAFDNDPNTKWLDHNDWSGAPTAEDPSWVQIDFPSAVAVDSLGITSANDGEGRDPENFNLVGSNDGGVTWVVLGEWLGEAFDERFERKLFSVDNALAFETYRFNITKNKGDDTLMQIGEIEFIGPVLPGLNHGRTDGAVITARNRIGDGEAETMAFDGDVNTKWLDHNDWSGAPTVEDPSWVQVQLPAAATVNKLGIVSANDGDVRDPENFDLLASNDGTNWIVLNSWIGESFDERFERKQFSFGNDLSFSFYRLNITKNKGDDTLMQVAEIELIGPQFSSVDHSSADDAVITARNRIGDGEAETMAFDDDVNTKWLDHNDWSGAPTVEDPSWVQVDFTNARIVTSIAITSANDGDVRDPENFALVGSNDGGVTWEPIANWIGESFDNRFERRLFEMGNGFAYTTYRLNISKNKGDDTLMQIAEIELIGPDSQ